MTTSEHWREAIQQARLEPDPERSNRQITELHFALSEALVAYLGRESGPNFHTWAVWGSRKAGVTIRQEDLDSAIHNATATAGIVGGVVGAGTGVAIGRLLRLGPDLVTAIIGLGMGCIGGAWTGREIAIWSRSQAAQLVLAGNQTVLEDIGEQSARFLELLEGGATGWGREAFFAGLRSGPSEAHGQDRLATAFHHYLRALDSDTLSAKREAMIAGNCESVHHEHIRLEPYIRGAMPFIVRRCTTKRQMSFEVGQKTLAVAEDILGVSIPTAAKNWTNIEERMRYIFALFRRYHNDPEAFSTPYPGPSPAQAGVPEPRP